MERRIEREAIVAGMILVVVGARYGLQWLGLVQ
jgi:hypothetical protein